MATGVKEVEEALAGLREGLVADGYDLAVEDVSKGVARVRIVAGPEACVECLVPQPMMTRMFLVSLEHLRDVNQVEVLYPEEPAEH